MSKIKNAFIKLKIKLQQFGRRLRLDNSDFTIISNNCWATTAVYQPFGLKYNTPTIGLFIMDEDYIRFVERLNWYLQQSLTFINPEQSKFYHKISAGGTKTVNYPIAILGDDVELHFLHYHNQSEALKKWRYRTKRINYNRLLIKMSLRDQGYDKSKMCERFAALRFKNKICFSPVVDSHSDIIFVPELENLNLVGGDETEITLKEINLYKLLNGIQFTET